MIVIEILLGRLIVCFFNQRRDDREFEKCPPPGHGSVSIARLQKGDDFRANLATPQMKAEQDIQPGFQGAFGCRNLFVNALLTIFPRHFQQAVERNEPFTPPVPQAFRKGCKFGLTQCVVLQPLRVRGPYEVFARLLGQPFRHLWDPFHKALRTRLKFLQVLLVQGQRQVGLCALRHFDICVVEFDRIEIAVQDFRDDFP